MWWPRAFPINFQIKFNNREKSFAFNRSSPHRVQRPPPTSTMLLLTVFVAFAHLASATPLQHLQVRPLAHPKVSQPFSYSFPQPTRRSRTLTRPAPAAPLTSITSPVYLLRTSVSLPRVLVRPQSSARWSRRPVERGSRCAAGTLRVPLRPEPGPDAFAADPTLVGCRRHCSRLSRR